MGISASLGPTSPFGCCLCVFEIVSLGIAVDVDFPVVPFFHGFADLFDRSSNSRLLEDQEDFHLAKTADGSVPPGVAVEEAPMPRRLVARAIARFLVQEFPDPSAD